jgi:NTE family protein
MKIGLVLSGGGARGIAHLGVVKALQEMGIPFDQIAGTSAGAITGALIAQGYSPDESLKIIESSSFVRHLRPAWNRMGLLRIDTAIDLYRKYLPHDSFEALQIPLHVLAVDLNDGEQVVFESGELIRPVLASCCLPGIFEPMLINKRQFVDGGVLISSLDRTATYWDPASPSPQCGALSSAVWCWLSRAKPASALGSVPF